MGNIPQQVGAAARDELAHINAGAYSMNRALFNAPADILSALGHGAYDFGRGFFGGAPAAAAAPAVHPAIAAAMGQPSPGAPVTQLTDKSMAQYGALTPAARAVLGNIDPNGVVKNAPNAPDPNAAALQGVPTWAQMMAGYAAGHGGNISLRAIDALAGAAAKGAQAGSAAKKLPSIADVAGQQALQLGTELFNQQKDDAIKSGDKNAYLKAALEHQDRLERLARARAIDPVSANGFSGGGN
jgi:hypothetical protein